MGIFERFHRGSPSGVVKQAEQIAVARWRLPYSEFLGEMANSSEFRQIYLAGLFYSVLHEVVPRDLRYSFRWTVAGLAYNLEHREKTMRLSRGEALKATRAAVSALWDKSLLKDSRGRRLSKLADDEMRFYLDDDWKSRIEALEFMISWAQEAHINQDQIAGYRNELEQLRKK